MRLFTRPEQLASARHAGLYQPQEHKAGPPAPWIQQHGMLRRREVSAPIVAHTALSLPPLPRSGFQLLEQTKEVTSDFIKLEAWANENYRA